MNDTRWRQLKHFLIFTPKIGGRWSQFDLRRFFRGVEINHQLNEDVSPLKDLGDFPSRHVSEFSGKLSALLFQDKIPLGMVSHVKDPGNLAKHDSPFSGRSSDLELQGGPLLRYKYGYNPFKWSYNWVTGVTTLLIVVITPLITGRGPLCSYVYWYCWCFRNPIPNHRLDGAKTLWIMGKTTVPSTGFAGFLNHQQYIYKNQNLRSEIWATKKHQRQTLGLKLDTIGGSRYLYV